MVAAGAIVCVCVCSWIVLLHASTVLDVSHTMHPCAKAFESSRQACSDSVLELWATFIFVRFSLLNNSVL